VSTHLGVRAVQLPLHQQVAHLLEDQPDDHRAEGDHEVGEERQPGHAYDGHAVLILTRRTADTIMNRVVGESQPLLRF
jgi:hypothetical protein